MNTRKWMVFAGVAVALVAVLAFAPAAFAQGPDNGYGSRDGSGPIGDGPFGLGYGQGPGAGSAAAGTMFRMGGPDGSLIAVTAAVLEVDRVELVAQLQGGNSIADVAGEYKVTVDEIVDAFLAPRAEHLEELVANEQFTQEEANDLLATMEADVIEQLNQPWSPQGRGPEASGTAFVDEDGDAVCDYAGTGRGGARRGRWE